MDGPVTWPQIYFIFGLSTATVGFACWLVYRICERVGQIEKRLTRIETKLHIDKGGNGEIV